MPPVIFFACLDLEQKSSFLDGHYLFIEIPSCLRMIYTWVNIYDFRLMIEDLRNCDSEN